MNSIIARKKAGFKLSREEIETVVRGATTGEIPDYQLSAFLMAVCWRGMDVEERSHLTRAMAASGRKLDFSAIPGTKVDKHSTGGVGDKTSLVLAPWLAAAGKKVPMISGRGLGFTGGTLDKLAAVPGYDFNSDPKRLSNLLSQVGCFIIGQSADIAPADKKLYALRDVTATVDEISLITASILSKKLAEDIGELVMDVKCGSGAFMQNRREALALARSIADTAHAAGVKTSCLITAMDFPLGRFTGNALETWETLQFCEPDGIYYKTAEKIINKKKPFDPDEQVVRPLVELTLELAVAMLEPIALKDLRRRQKAMGDLMELWRSGALKKKQHEWLTAQGANLSAFAEKVKPILQALEASKGDDGDSVLVFTAPQAGSLAHADGQAIGNLMVELGAGRRRAEDSIDDRTTLEMLAWRGKKLAKNEPILRIYKAGFGTAERQLAMRVLNKALVIRRSPPPPQKVILTKIATP
ncbi:MAG: thymidine phosphorylase [Turneriella sp.]|nr:thymidine phosphorylase [Leptospiraceae bacterium]MCX7633253.1 thymidine phosphorylase [Turneriella sp.]